mmetsp:Transcript_86781/g.176674  ORF Transcript_86781/g.176674 Transcript_86781/m.176674 type:complete len:248 (-) Transcript_86781:207-950(-)|eukprot:CAMPEP_0201173360 /NCGR_PEP_ID=MMETSP0851-20130426/94929_1 /ASSEMBLY_ACC=CAM_ASM_000631 /TAXON_ID=183588 /ORGANISM="Pseudo-nitzschia fraudulenta, Strain WWA7" /LENGTH=247 /DNA_ID=CAMNT_0047456089 /DNA_START=169 /DNA_END=912 /DNA_ORIENTATION=-
MQIIGVGSNPRATYHSVAFTDYCFAAPCPHNNSRLLLQQILHGQTLAKLVGIERLKQVALVDIDVVRAKIKDGPRLDVGTIHDGGKDPAPCLPALTDLAEIAFRAPEVNIAPRTPTHNVRAVDVLLVAIDFFDPQNDSPVPCRRLLLLRKCIGDGSEPEVFKDLADGCLRTGIDVVECFLRFDSADGSFVVAKGALIGTHQHDSLVLVAEFVVGLVLAEALGSYFDPLRKYLVLEASLQAPTALGVV